MGSIKLKTKIVNDKYTEYVYEAFDIQNKEETEVEILYNLSEAKSFDWNIGVILGGSGTGKTTILKKMGDVKKVNFDSNKSLISNFDWLEPKDAALVLTSMGLSSVPTWLRPFHVLSNGEQYRATLAYLVSSANDDEVVLVDEYTSVVDRDVAKAMSFALQKYIRKTNKRIILASCHYDILEWLMPDWTCSPQKGGALERGECLRQGRPQIKLQVSRVEPDTWNFFKKHHYLTEDCSKSCNFFLFSWNDKPIGINAVIPQPSGHFKNGVRESRIVVLPDYQGLGLGTTMSNFTAAIYKNNGYRYFTKTVHPAIGVYRNNNKDIWRGTSKNGKSPKAQNAMGGMSGWNVFIRTSYCHEYIGEEISGYEELLKPIKQMREAKKLTLF
jgi:ABC-type lipoprotein export system ATPase subunit/GNAT superfamily N-acetyltransferase